MCWAFSLFLLVYEIIHPKVGQWEILVVPLGDNMSRKSILNLVKAQHTFDALISEERFGQISLKSRKSTFRINSFEYGEFAEIQNPCFRPCNIFRV